MTPQQQIRELRNKLLGEPKLEFGCEVSFLNEEFIKTPKLLEVLDKRETKGVDAIIEIRENNSNGIRDRKSVV